MGKGRHRYKYKCVWKYYFSITVQWVYMKLGVGIAPNSRCLTLLLGHWNSFSFCVENVLVSRFIPPFKCTVDKNFKCS